MLTIENASITLDDPISLSAASYVYAKAGERDKALEILRGLENKWQKDKPAVHIAQIYVGLGDYEQAFAWLEKASAERSVWLIWLGVDPTFDPLRGDPRFQELMRSAGFPE